MDNFIKINTLYNSEAYRTVHELAKVYDDDDQLKDIIKELISPSLLSGHGIAGKRILLKPNWVKHSSTSDDELCLRTNDKLLLILVKVLLENAPASIMIGDAPIQGCNWNKMISSIFLNEISALSTKYNIPIVVKDFRRVTFDAKNNKLTKDRSDLSNYVIFDLGKESYLESISTNEAIFRVTKYDPDRLAESHKLGMHKYCITEEIFNADVIISVPKIKTHQKTGITGALKNLVGINGDKDYLPHHRIGGTEIGGDCYPGKNKLRYLAEMLLDSANRRIGKKEYIFLTKLSSLCWKLSNPKPVHQMAAGWHGNDTCWRMVMDLNRIATHGNKDGTLSEKPNRVLYSICDGIIGGQGNGPLDPIPLPLGVLAFTNNSALADICFATLMGFDPIDIPLLEFAQKFVDDNSGIEVDGKKIELTGLNAMAVDTLPAPGWTEHLKRKK